jgi:hypothetical protein
MTQAVSRRPVPVENRVPSQVRPCEFCGGVAVRHFLPQVPLPYPVFHIILSSLTLHQHKLTASLNEG